MILFHLLIFFLSLLFLIKFSDIFTENAEKVGVFFNLPPFIIGILILSIGTSLPELVSSIIASMNQESNIILGNVIGSNISNILLIIGISTIITKKIKIFYEIEKIEIPFLFGTTIFMAYTLMDGKIDIIEGIFLCLSFLTYIHYSVCAKDKELKKEIKREIPKKRKVNEIVIPIFIILISIVVIYFSAEYLINSIENISKELNISTLFISSTLLAVGTSLPELIVTISTIKKKNIEMGIGNIIGSNIFNISLIIGVSAIINPIIVNTITISFLIPFLIGITILFIVSSITKEISYWEGILYLIIFCFYVYKLYTFG